MKVFKDDEVILDEPVGVGRSERPTPGGVYYLKELLQPPDPNGAYGVYAYGLSGFSNVLQSFNGGPGVIGIHGTNEPDKVGTDVSSGCIRLNNEAIEPHGRGHRPPARHARWRSRPDAPTRRGGDGRRPRRRGRRVR